MTRFRLLSAAVSVTILLWILGTAVQAQDEPPPPYAGLKNPFPWDNTSTQEAGKELYRQSCLGCHGVDGSNLATADFSAADYPQSLQERPDFSFWIFSEGRLDKGMPPYKSSLSEEQRWQVLTYLSSLGVAAPSEVTPPPTKPPSEGEKATLQLTAPQQAQAGQPLTLSALLQDSQGEPIGSATVKFFIRVDFFASGLMEIGEAATDARGVASFESTLRQAGDIQVVARYETIETAATLTVAETGERFYQTESGLHLPAPGEEVLIGPKSALEPGEMDKAPTSAFRLPGGILSWLLLLVGAVALTWVTYFRVMYHVFRIPIVSEIVDTDTRLVPLLGLAIVTVLGILLVLMFLTGPHSYFHLLW